MTMPRIEGGVNKDLSPIISNLSLIVLTAGTIACASFIGTLLSSFGAAFFGAATWVAIYIAFGLRIIPEKEVWVFERLGQFHCIRRPGIYIGCFVDIIDKVKQRVPLYKQPIYLWSDPTDTNNKVDFKDGSCPVKALIWYRPRQKSAVNGGKDILNESVYHLTYNYSDLYLWIEEHLDTLIRVPLQGLTIDDASAQKNEIAKKASQQFEQDLTDESGIESEGILITDIVLSDSQIEQREKKLQGVKDAEGATARARGYIDPIKLIIEEAKKAGKDITFDEAKDLFNQQRAFETISATGSNMTFVSPDLKGVMMTMDVTSKNKPSSTPPDNQSGLNPRRRKGGDK